MWIPVSRFRYNTSLFYPCGEQRGELVCFYRRAVMTKGVTAPLLPLPSAILLTRYKMGHRYKVVQLIPSSSSQSVQGFICPCRVYSLHH